MKIKDYKCKCGHNDFFLADKGVQKGIYCSYCGKWLKWADKDEQNLAMKSKQECILDKIRAEIQLHQSDYDVRGTDYDRIAWKVFDSCLRIINKYKAESEYKE